MSDLISREALLKDISRIGGFPWSEWETAGVFDIVNKQPSVDAAPVVHGRWEQHDQFDEDANTYVCSVCGEPWVIIDGTPAENNMKFCPSCGARMDLPEGEEARDDG